MKTTATLVLLLGLLALASAMPLGPGNLWGDCCDRVHKVPISVRKIQKMVKSPSSCKLAAIIVTTDIGVRRCLDPTWHWAQEQLKNYEARSANNL